MVAPVETSSCGKPATAAVERPWGVYRWWVYQRERFPVLPNGLLILTFSSSAVCYSALLRNDVIFPSLLVLLTAFLTCFFFFLQLRIADEFKDFDEDAQYRPYRAVPRGLVRLGELRNIWLISASLQFILALWLEPKLALWVLLVTLYLALMTREFFARDWLKARPITYMLSHMMICPLIDFFATACDWARFGNPPAGLGWFILASYFNGIVWEVGRKIRAPSQEEPGVETYTAMWGIPRAVGAWLLALISTACFILLAAWKIDFFLPVLMVAGALLLLASAYSFVFIRKRSNKLAKGFEAASGVWTLFMYLMLGIVPFVIRHLGAQP